ncbi:ABC transporter ATP-binding protein [Antarctobacter sp.]|uniref:ABC transporter ATP-binding protein n=1 Tax=Antarctobacter sp. TaxID=1872577 RepID=UPI003A8EF71C
MFDTQNAPLVTVRNLRKVYTTGSFLNRAVTNAVDDVSFDIRPGETLGLVGESGSGKSTMGRLLAGLEEVTAGEVRFAGSPLDRSDRRGLLRLWRDTQMVFQDPYSSLNPILTVRQCLMEPLRNFGVASGVEAERLVRKTITACGLPVSALDRYPSSFSGGQRQRVGIARALIIKPRFIIADEPVSALDVSIQAQIVNLMQDLKADFGLTYLFVAHDLALVRHVSDRIAVMYRGRVVEIGDTDAIYDRPQHPYTRLLTSSIPIPDVQRERARVQMIKGMATTTTQTGASGCRFAPRCPIATEVCTRLVPQLKSTASGQQAACHLAPEAPGTPEAKTR